MTISCGQGGVLSVYCVCQKVFVSPSTALAPLPSSLAVSSLSTLTNLSAGLFAVAVAGVDCVAGTTAGKGCVSGATELVCAAGIGDGVFEAQPNPISATIEIAGIKANPENFLRIKALV